MGVIYKVTNLKNGKVYIGQTNDFKRRKREHLNAAKKNKDNFIFHKALRKYGEEAFKWEIIEEVSKEELNVREIFWIEYFNSYKNGYNLTKGGDNADALLRWKKENPKKVQENILKANQGFLQYQKENPEKVYQQRVQAQKQMIKVVKKKVLCVDLNLTFSSLSDAEKWSLSLDNPNGKKASHQHISKVCKGQRKTAGGYQWQYV